jgi:hypothetical protein
MDEIGISLGNVCYSAVWSKENGIRKSREDGYKTCPFDLMISNYNGIVKCIKEDFSNFCNIEYLKITDNGLINTYYNFGFNHESPEHKNQVENKYLYEIENWPEGKNHFINDNYKNFIKRYTRRISSFVKYLKNPNNKIIFVIQFVYESKPEDDLKDLKDALKEKYPELIYDIIILDSDKK